MTHFLLVFLTVIILLGLYKLLQYLFLNKAAYANKNFAALKIQYAGYYLKYQGLFFLIASIVSFLLYKLLPWMLDYKLSFITGGILIVKSGEEDVCLVTALFSGLFVAVIAIFMLIKRQLKDDYPDYLAFLSRRYRFDAVVITKYMMVAYAVAIEALIIIFFGHYTAFGQREIKISRPFNLDTKTYKYSDVVSVKEVERLYAPNGNIVDDPHYIIQFSDGNKWNSREDGFKTYELNKDVINLIKANTNLSPVKIEFDR